jgi:hypothetical protein
VIGLATLRIALLALVLLLATVASATASAGANGGCVTYGKKWLAYDAHGGSTPKLTASGTTYYVNVMGVSCAYAKAALTKMFPLMTRPPYGRMVTLKGGPASFSCRSQVGDRPDIAYGGQCANIATHKLFQWSAYDPNA